MDIRTAQRELRLALAGMYGQREASLIAEMTMAHVTALSRVDRILHDGDDLSDGMLQEYTRCRSELTAWRPVQYVIGEAWFDGLRFRVDQRVLIPRPETEELVDWVAGSAAPFCRILDIGTGSGCIAIALKKRLPSAFVMAVDACPDALSLAKENALRLDADVGFMSVDILDPSARSVLPSFDVIVSNPPYVTGEDRPSLRPNVAGHEPAKALFVEGPDPLLFYRSIIDFSKGHLLSGGALFFETHSLHGEAVRRLMERQGFTGTLMRRDLQGLERMVCGRMSNTVGTSDPISRPNPTV